MREIIQMSNHNQFEAIIIGGSYAGLSAAMALGRSLRKVLVIDSGLPCNRQTPHAHNFITQDGEEPAIIAEKARLQVQQYPTVHFFNGIAAAGKKTGNGFELTTSSGETFSAPKLIFATGVKDIMPELEGFAECWGISVIHCPYCHGYEVRHEKTGILANGDVAFHLAQLIRNWTNDLTIFTNGKSTLSPEQMDTISRHNIPVIEKPLSALKHESGMLKALLFKDGTAFPLKALYARPVFEQHCRIPEMLGCALNEHGYIEVNGFYQTSIEHVYACGDATSMMRSVANAVAGGNMAGAMVNNELTMAAF
ncbi:MAG: NAD(P)/FAD-dependent oxidoreductase [Chitinophagaceae bacterium]